MKRIIAVDLAKGICIILVVAGHYLPLNSPGWYRVLNDLIYSFHMPLFLFASGYIYMETKREEKYGTFIFRKIKRLMIPYISLSLVIVTIKLLSLKIAGVQSHISWNSYLEILYKPSAAAFFWFIWVLFIIFLIIPLFKTKTSRLLFFVASIVFESLYITLPPVFCLNELKQSLLFFLLGVVIVDQAGLREAALKTPAVLGYGLFLGLFALSMYLKDSVIYEKEWYSLLILKFLPYLGIFSICKLSLSISRLKISSKFWLLLVASNSFIIYLYHTSFMGFAKAVLQKIPSLFVTQNQLIFSAIALTIIFVGVICPILLNIWLIQKNKVLHLLFG
jgi:fucose 4-O-acetylase-like acetyltransferase